MPTDRAQDTEAIRAALEAATPGPWTYDGRDILRVPLQNHGFNIVVPLPETWHESQRVNEADAELIALAPAALAWLLTERDRLVARLEAAEQALAALLDCKGSFNGTVSQYGGDPAVCTKCEAMARAALAAAAPGETGQTP